MHRSDDVVPVFTWRWSVQGLDCGHNQSRMTRAHTVRVLLVVAVRGKLDLP